MYTLSKNGFTEKAGGLPPELLSFLHAFFIKAHANNATADVSPRNSTLPESLLHSI